MEFARKLQEQASQLWSRFSLPQRITLCTFAVMLVMMLGVVGYWSARPNFVPVAAGLSPEETALASSKLKDADIPFHYEAGRGLLAVPSGRLEDARMVLVELGLPGGKGHSEGFELFDKNSFGMTEFVQKVNYQRALQGRLEKQIAILDGVETAHVTLAVPDDQLFIRQQQEAKASVEVKMRRGADLRSGQVASIRHLVSAAVPRLRPENVAVMDTEGRLLAKFQSGEDEFASAGDQFENRMRVERYLADKVDGLLTRTLGPGQAAVQVAVELDYNRVERRSEKKDPNSEVLMRQVTHTKESKGSASESGGVPGVRSNTPGADAASNNSAAQPGGRSQTEKDITTDFHFDTVTEMTRPEVGAIKRISVAVMLKPRMEGTGDARKPVSLSNAELAKLSDIIKNSVGFSAARNDEVRVENAPAVPDLDTPAPSAIETGAAGVERWMGIASSLAPLVGVLVLGLVLMTALKRLSAQTPAVMPSSPSSEPIEIARGNRIAKSANIQSELQGLVTKNSAQAAEIIRTMMRN